MRWTAVAQAASQAVWVLANPILFRLLTPSEYGLSQTALVALGIFSAITGLGITVAVIQRPQLSEGELQTAFWASLMAAGLVFVLGAGAAPFIAWLYGEPSLLWLCLAYAGSFFFGAATTMAVAILSRDLRFDRQVGIGLFSALSEAGFTIGLAYAGFGAMSLALGALFAKLPAAAVALKLSGFRPRLHFKWDELKSLRRFSLYYTGEVAANYLYNNIDYLTVSYVLGRAAHGVYTQAFKLVHYPYDQFTPVVQRVMLAAFSRQQHDDAALREGYLAATRGLAVLCAPLLIFFAVAAEFIVGAYLGERWLPAVPYVRILAAVGGLKCVVTCVGLILNAKGRADLGFRWNLIALAVMTAGMLVGVRYGVVGVCWAWVITFLPQAAAILAITHRLVGLKNRDFLKALAPAAVFAVVFFAYVYGLRLGLYSTFGERHGLVGLILLGAALPVYVLGVRSLCPEFWEGVFGRKKPQPGIAPGPSLD
jgi:O-antigen/teichoic acid export membrane protein